MATLVTRAPQPIARKTYLAQGAADATLLGL